MRPVAVSGFLPAYNGRMQTDHGEVKGHMESWIMAPLARKEGRDSGRHACIANCIYCAMHCAMLTLVVTVAKVAEIAGRPGKAFGMILRVARLLIRL